MHLTGGFMKPTILLLLLLLAIVVIVFWLQIPPFAPSVASPLPPPIAPRPVYKSWVLVDESKGWLNQMTCYFAIEEDGTVLIRGTHRSGLTIRTSIAQWTINPQGKLYSACFEERADVWGGIMEYPGPCGPRPLPPDQCIAKYLGTDSQIPFRSQVYIERRLRAARISQ